MGDIYKSSDMNKVIDEYVHNKRDREILKARYIDGVRFEPLAEKFNLSVRHTKNIVYKYENLIFSKIKSNLFSKTLILFSSSLV